jgi:hypothetical protein
MPRTVELDHWIKPGTMYCSYGIEPIALRLEPLREQTQLPDTERLQLNVSDTAVVDNVLLIDLANRATMKRISSLRNRMHFSPALAVACLIASISVLGRASFHYTSLKTAPFLVHIVASLGLASTALLFNFVYRSSQVELEKHEKKFELKNGRGTTLRELLEGRRAAYGGNLNDQNKRFLLPAEIKFLSAPPAYQQQ